MKALHEVLAGFPAFEGLFAEFLRVDRHSTTVGDLSAGIGPTEPGRLDGLLPIALNAGVRKVTSPVAYRNPSNVHFISLGSSVRIRENSSSRESGLS